MLNECPTIHPWSRSCDFEALVEPLQNTPGKTASYIPCGYAYLIIGPNGLPLKPVTVYRGSDAVNHFIESTVRDKDILAAKLRTITPMHMTTRDLEEFQKATHCNLCKKWLGKDRMRDHDHLSGKYRAYIPVSICPPSINLRKQLPPRSAFHSSLTNEGISEAEYEHTQTVWKCFNIKDLGEYHDLYFNTGVILLSDAFENFHKLTQNFYQLDAAHMLTSPGLAWQAALRMADVKLELCTDINMHLFIEKGIRGGVSMISHRHSEANHPQCPNYDSNRANKYIIYLDANNLYGFSMSQPLPVNNFQWLSPEEVSLHEICQHTDDATTGYILEVDMEYPPELHDLHNNYPLAPE
ncbi:hypothetical protein AVEN_80263-1 [Araneus ventricosus]|uniref:DNA-directed DNA polymerase n=1 Tax=Araneus ventricosus TaxID=182803 RepID=A0A4Y2MP12_ARAVE|nr:hypothetical protein AVEN_80263-1 [Araneus ventricosus]